MFKRDTNSLKKQTGTMTPPATGALNKRSTQNLVPEATISYTEFRVTVLTDLFQSRGTLRSVGLLTTFINDEQKPTIALNNAEVTGFDPTNPATRITPEELVIRKRVCQVVAFDKVPEAGQVVLLARTETLSMYTDRFAIQGKFHMGTDDRLTDFTESALQSFIVVSDARIFPLFQPRSQVIATAPLLMIHRTNVRMYHKV